MSCGRSRLRFSLPPRPGPAGSYSFHVKKRRLLIAAGLLLALVLWLASGHLTRPPVQPTEPEAPRPEFTVAARISQAGPVTRSIVLQGETEPNRRVTVRAETSGVVEAVQAERGSRVAADQVIVRLAPAERQARLRQAEARVAQAELAHEAARELAEQALQSPIEERQVFAALQEAQAELELAREAMRQLVVRAPFAGSLNDRFVEVGDYLTPGAEVAEVVENRPLLVRVDLPQHEIGRVDGQNGVQVRIPGTEPVTGRIRFVAAAANPATRTFPLEIEVENPHGVPAGLSAQAEIALETVQAHFISPALFSLDVQGVLGVKVADAEDRVRFHPVTLVRAEPEGAWVSGLPPTARIITVGQGFVEPGQRVQVVMDE